MNNVLVEKVKEIEVKFNEKWNECNCEGGFDIGLCNRWGSKEVPSHAGAVGNIRGFISTSIIALLEADCDRLNNRIGEVLDERQGNEQMWIVRELRREITYKQQAIKELKNN